MKDLAIFPILPICSSLTSAPDKGALSEGQVGFPDAVRRLRLDVVARYAASGIAPNDLFPLHVVWYKSLLS